MIDSLLRLVEQKLHEAIANDSSNHQHHYTSLKISLSQSLNSPIPLSAVTMNQSFFLCKPDSAITLLGLGSLISLKAQGKQRFNTIKSDYTNILQLWKNKKLIAPAAFHAFAFDENDPMTGDWSGLPNTLLTIPLILFKEVNKQQTLFININLLEMEKQENYISQTMLQIETLLNAYFKEIEHHNNKQSEFEHELISNPLSISWLQLTKKALKKIHSGAINKIVTSRQFTIQKDKKTSLSQLSQNLINKYPGCTILSYHFCGKTIIAASPEHLLILDHPDIQSDAIGGTIHKQANKHHTINYLSDKNKLLKEHDFIVQAIYQGLDSLCHTLKMPISPFLMKLHNMYHLETPIHGKLKDQYDLFDVIETLHPTPAVAGYPTQKAQQWLLDNEDYQRGWYTGAFGVLENNSQGKINGQLSVMLRCAIINENKITLFAGAGLIAESEPEIEWQETELKMQTILEIV